MKGKRNIVELARNEETLVERGYCPVGILGHAEQMAVDRLEEMRGAGAQAASPNSGGSESEPRWKGKETPAHTDELVCGQGLGRAAGDIE